MESLLIRQEDMKMMENGLLCNKNLWHQPLVDLIKFSFLKNYIKRNPSQASVLNLNS